MCTAQSRENLSVHLEVLARTYLVYKLFACPLPCLVDFCVSASLFSRFTYTVDNSLLGVLCKFRGKFGSVLIHSIDINTFRLDTF